MNNIQTQSPNFKALEMKKLIPEHRSIARTELSYLKKLGEKYDVTLRSSSWNPGWDISRKISILEIVIRKLGDNNSFFKRMFNPNGKAAYITEFRHMLGAEKTTLKRTIDVAVDNYEKNRILKRQDHLR